MTLVLENKNLLLSIVIVHSLFTLGKYLFSQVLVMLLLASAILPSPHVQKTLMHIFVCCVHYPKRKILFYYINKISLSNADSA